MVNSRINKKNYRRKKIVKRLLIFFTFLFVIIGSYFAYAFYHTYLAASQSYNEIEGREKSNLRDTTVNISDDPISILLMGLEGYSSGDTVERTDTLILATFNPKDQTMKLLSIPRDTLVEIPGREGYDKINHAYAFGEKELTIETLEGFLDIPIDYYTTVNFKGFKNIIDEIGGVTVDVPFDFWELSDRPGAPKLYFTEGKMKLDGEEALAYARMRQRDPRGDFGRNERQRQIVVSTLESLVSPSNLFKIDDISKVIGKNVETNVKMSEGLNFSKKYKNFNSSKIETLGLEGEDTYINNVYYYEINEESLEEVKDVLKDHLEINNDKDTDTQSENE